MAFSQEALGYLQSVKLDDQELIYRLGQVAFGITIGGFNTVPDNESESVDRAARELSELIPEFRYKIVNYGNFAIFLFYRYIFLGSFVVPY